MKQKYIILFCLVFGLLLSGVSALVFYDNQGQAVVPCGQSIFECITTEKVSKVNDTGLLTSTVLNKLFSEGKSVGVLWKE